MIISLVLFFNLVSILDKPSFFLDPLMRKSRLIFYFSSFWHNWQHVPQIFSSSSPISPSVLSIVNAGANSSPVIVWYQRTLELHKPLSNHQNSHYYFFSTEPSIVLEIKLGPCMRDCSLIKWLKCSGPTHDLRQHGSWCK